MSPLDRHERIALSVSGGKDSLACVTLLRDQLHRLAVYHCDTGDQLPELQASVAYVESIAPHFVRVRSDVRDWIGRNGLPSDLVPYASHPIGRALGQERVAIVPRYDCCGQNIMLPLLERMQADGITLIIRGTKRADMPRLPFESGQSSHGMELFLPLEDWTDADVLTFLRAQDVPVPVYYDAGLNTAPDCAHCTAWWNEGRATFLKAHHPAVYAEYRAGLETILHSLGEPMRWLNKELA